MANPFAKYAQPEQDEGNPFAKFVQQPVQEGTNPFAQFVQPQTAPVVTTGPNPLNPKQEQPVAPEQDKSFAPIEEAGKGIKSGVTSVKSIPTSAGAFADVGAALTNLNTASLYDKIDKGEITDPTQIKGGSDFETSRARMYFNSKPEVRAQLKEKANAEVGARKESVLEAVNILKRYQQENLANKGRTEDFTDIEGVKDFTNWAAYNLGSAGVQLVPLIVAGVTTGGLGLFATGATMELSGGVQNRLNFIDEKTKDIKDPKAKADAIVDYVAKTGDVTLASALASGGVDVMLGPAAALAKRPLLEFVKNQTRKEVIKEIPKAIAKQGAEELVAGGTQEAIQIAAERAIGEQTGDLITSENIKRIVNSATAEAVGGGFFGGAGKATQAAFTKKEAKETDTPEGRALRGLDDLAAREEKAGTTKEMTVPSTEGEVIPGADVTQVEAKGILENLTTQLGREPTDQEFEDAYDDYISQRTGTGAGTSVPSAEDIVQPQPDTSAGVVAPPEGAGLGVSDTDVTGVGVPETTEPSALETPQPQPQPQATETELPRVDSIPRFAFGPTSITPVVIAEGKPLYRETNVDGLNDLFRANNRFEYSGAFVTDNPDLALGQGDNKGVQVEFRPNSISGEENIKPMTGDIAGREFKSDVIAPRAIQSVTFANAKDLNRTSGMSKRALNAEFDKAENSDGSITFTRKGTPSTTQAIEAPQAEAPAPVETPEQDIATLEKAADDAHSAVRQLTDQQLGMLTKAGRAPAKNSPKRAQYDALSGQIEKAKETWNTLDRKLNNAKKKPAFSTAVSPEEKLVQQGMAVGNLHPTIVDAIANNDLNGALKLISGRLGGFYGELANKLAELNLPTGIRIGDQRNMTRQSIDASSAPAQIQLFNFIRVAMPDVYNKYFQGYDKAENIEKVYDGLKHILNNPKLKSVLPQYRTVFETYNNNIDGLKAFGAYYPTFDEININDSVDGGLTYHTLLHETVHAATEILLRTPADQLTVEQNEAINELKKLFYVAKANSKLNHYGFTNLSEFIAEVFTNKKFQNELKSIPYTPARTNMFNRFIKTIMDMFGLDNIAGRAMYEAQKLFNVERPTKPVSAGPRFAARKRGPISSSWRTVEDTMKSVKDWETIKNDLMPAMWDATNGVFRNVMLGVMNLRQIADVTKTKFPQIDAAIRTIEKMLAYRGKIMNDGGDIIKKWTKAQSKNLKGSQLLGRVMLEATIRGVEVDPQSKEYNVLKVNKELADAWNALGSDFQQIYRDVRDFYVRAVQETVRLMKERANNVTDPVERQELIDKIDAQFGPDKLKGPYFPLRRFGEFWFQVGEGNFKEFYMYESRIARTLAMRNRKRELSRGNAQQRALAETMDKGNGMSALYGQNVGTTKILQDVQEIVDSIGNSVVDTATGLPRDKTQAELKGEIRDSLNQLIYILLPQQSMRKMFINRKAIQGASGDMLRVFATHAVHSAYQRSRFKYAQDFMDNLSNAQDWIRSFAKGDKAEVYRDYVNEVEKRSKTILGTEDTSLAAKVAGKLSESVFYFMLSAPFTSMLNVIGFAQIAMPYIGGRFGYANANKRILENMGKYLQTVPKRTFSPLAKGAVMDMAFPSIVEGGKLEGILKDAAQQLLDEEQINISLTNDVLNIGEGPTAAYTGTYNAVKRGISALFHQSERLNREVTLLSVVELAYEKLISEPIKDARGIVKRDAQGQPMRFTNNATTSDGTTQYSKEALELAINEAKDIAGLALGDFTRQMKPRYFTPPLLSVLTKFKQYSVLASYAIIRNAQLGLIKPFSKAELDELRGILEEHYKTAVDKDQIIEQQMAEAQERQKEVAKEARRRLAGILGMTYLFGGYVAMPFFSTVTPILVGMLAGEDDDDDEFFNWENWFKNYMETEFGGYVGAMLQKFGMDQEKANKAGRKVGETLVYGPASTVTGGALSDRVSLDLKNLWFRDGRYSPDTRESVIENLIANAGPVVGLTVNAADAWDLVQEGQIGRAFEKMAPALFAKPVTAARLATEGAKTKGGDTLVDELTTSEIALQSIGLQPLRIAQAQKASIETVQKAQKITNQHDSIMNRLWMERDNPETFSEILQKANEFSRKHPGYAITFETIKDSFKKRAEQSAIANTMGARIPKPLRSELGGMTEYGQE